MARRRGSRRTVGASGAARWPAAVVLAVVAALMSWGHVDAYLASRGRIQGHEPDNLPTLERSAAGYVSSSTCRSCHPGAYSSWHSSFHRTMTQVATPKTVVPSFDGVELELFGHPVVLSRENGELWADMVDPDFENAARARGVGLAGLADVPRARKRIVLVTGSHHMQVFWVRGANNAIVQFPFAYLFETGSWVPVDDTLLKPPQPYRDIATWNTTCDFCHTVAALPGVDFEARRIDTEVAELGIACEACHGPADAHVARHRGPLERYRHRLTQTAGADDTIVNPEKLTASASSQVCGQCHGIALPRDSRRWVREGDPYRPGGVLADSRDVILPASHPDSPRFRAEMSRDPNYLGYFFWSDGMVRVSGREYNGLVESGCFDGGELSCLSCHSMHDSDPDDQLADKMAGDAACLQCHDEYRAELESHTRHPASSSGSRCYNCHMPHTTYGLLKAIRSHLIDSPSVTASLETGRPNACNQCHLDRTLAWTQRALETWYDTPPVEVTGAESEVAASLLWLVRGDAGQRALAAWTLGWEEALAASGADWQAPFLARTLDDPYATVRYIAGRSLGRLPGFAGFAYDYVASHDVLASRRRDAAATWRASLAPRSPADRAALLLSADGGLDRDAWRRLLADRDNRPVMLQE